MAPGGGAGTGMFPCTGVGPTLPSAPFRNSPVMAAISLEVEGAARKTLVAKMLWKDHLCGQFWLWCILGNVLLPDGPNVVLKSLMHRAPCRVGPRD